MGKALAKRKVINGIEQIAFTHAIVAEKTIYLIREGKVGLDNVLEVDDR